MAIEPTQPPFLPKTRPSVDDHSLITRRRIHAEYTVPRLDFNRWALDCITWQGDECVLDLGAGPGSYFASVQARIPRGRHIAGDISMRMIARQKEQDAPVGRTNLDAQALPFPDDTFDVVLANHMLYHVIDIDTAVAEIHRVLKPEGLLLAATNSASNMPELNTLYRRAILLLTNFRHKTEISTNPSERFSLENGPAILSRQFYAVARYDLPSALIFPDAAPAIEYLDSTRDLRESALPDEVSWEQFMAVMRQQIVRLVAYAGQMVVKKLSGVLVATDSGGFVGEYINKLNA